VRPLLLQAIDGAANLTQESSTIDLAGEIGRIELLDCSRYRPEAGEVLPGAFSVEPAEPRVF
jgi:hypothetical protein